MANTRVENGRQHAIRIAKELCNLYLSNIDLIKTDADRKGDSVLSSEAEKTAAHITLQMQKVKSATDYNEIQQMLQQIVNVAMHNLNVLVLERSYELRQKREHAGHQLLSIRQLFNEVTTQVNVLENTNEKFKKLDLSENLKEKYQALEKQIQRIKTVSDLSVFHTQVTNFAKALSSIRDDINHVLLQQKKIPESIYQAKTTSSHFWQPRETSSVNEIEPTQHPIRKP